MFTNVLDHVHEELVAWLNLAKHNIVYMQRGGDWREKASVIAEHNWMNRVTPPAAECHCLATLQFLFDHML